MNQLLANPVMPPLRFLIVDDHAEMRAMTKLYLGESAVTCECDDGIDALGCYKKFLPDWVLMDWEMKQMDGLTATKQIISSFPDAKILLVTQFNDRELRAAATEAGAFGFVLKDELFALREIIAR